MTLSRQMRVVVAGVLSFAVIALVGIVVMVAFRYAWWLFLLILLLPVPNPMMLIVRPWGLAIKEIHRVVLKVQFVEEINLEGLRSNAPTVCVCNHPPAAFFPILVWAVMTHVSMWPLCVSKAKNLFNPFLALVIYPALVMKALAITARGNGHGARMVAWSTKLLVTRWSVLIIFADAHRPESSKARADYEKMRIHVPQIEWHDRLGAYHWKGTYAALEALGPDAQVVALAFSFPKGAVGWLAPWHAYGRVMAFRLRNVTERFQAAIIDLGSEGNSPQTFIDELNELSTEEDRWIAQHNP